MRPRERPHLTVVGMEVSVKPESNYQRVVIAGMFSLTRTAPTLVDAHPRVFLWARAAVAQAPRAVPQSRPKTLQAEMALSHAQAERQTATPHSNGKNSATPRTIS